MMKKKLLLKRLLFRLPILIIGILVFSNFFITKTFYTEVEINQSPEVVWGYLVDKSTYKDWNVILEPVWDGEGSGEGQIITEGKEVDYVMNYNNQKSEFASKVAKVTENQELRQKGGFFGLLTYEHSYLLEPKDNGEGTLLIQSEIDRGIGLLFWNSDAVEAAYKKSSENLKKLIEAGN